MSEELRTHTPGWREQIAAWLAQNVTGDTREGYKSANKVVDTGELATLPTPAGFAGPAYDVARGAGNMVSAFSDWMGKSSALEPKAKVDIPTAENRLKEIDARAAAINQEMLANGMNKKLSSTRTTELNAQMNAEKEKLATEREGLIGGISDTKQYLAQKEAPLREQYPNAVKGATAGAVGAAALLSRGIANKVTGGVEKATETARAARAAGNPAEYVEAVDAASRLSSLAPLKIAGGTAAAATLPADVQMLPDLIDYKSMPKDSRAYKEAAPMFDDPWAYAKSMAIPVASGLVGAGAGVAKSNIMGSTARADSAAMSRPMGKDYDANVKAVDKQMTSQSKRDSSRLNAERSQLQSDAASRAIVREIDAGPQTQDEMRALIAEAMQQTPVSGQQLQLAGPASRGKRGSFVSVSDQKQFEDEMRAAMAQSLMSKR